MIWDRGSQTITLSSLRGSEAANMANQEEKNLIEILEDNVPIDMAKYIKFVQSPHCGATATFAGTTRDTFEGKTVIELRYEAYVPMAIRCLKSICSAARSTWKIDSAAVAHRLGPVPVGDASVFVAVSAVHREDALDACKYVIDEIKASVPIWKKEVYEGGEIWKENSEFLERRKGGCCGVKVKVGDCGAAATATATAEGCDGEGI